MLSYRRLQQYALLISIASVLYNGAEGGLSIGFGAESESRSLVFFGIQSGIEVASACMVIWRFRRVAMPGEERAGLLDEKALKFERTGTLTIGVLLLLLALATEASAIAALALRSHPDSSNASLIISASALVIMILIWLPKRYLARALNSSTMAGEATCSLSCIQITLVLFSGSLIYRLWEGGWWVDSATSLMLGLLFGWEGYKMVRWARDENFDGGCCADCKPPRLEEGEMGEQYRDICECCEKKEECKAADSCQCSDCTGSTESGEKEGCCGTRRSVDEKCCTRELKQGRRPAQANNLVDLERADSCQDECCAAPKRAVPVALAKRAASPAKRQDACQDACCSPSIPQAGPSSKAAEPVDRADSCEDGCCGGTKKVEEKRSASPAGSECSCC